MDRTWLWAVVYSSFARDAGNTIAGFIKVVGCVLAVTEAFLEVALNAFAHMRNVVQLETKFNFAGEAVIKIRACFAWEWACLAHIIESGIVIFAA
jgi:hypothetical protein